MTIIQENKSIFSSLKFKFALLFIFAISFFYILCFSFTATEEFAKKKKYELSVLASKKLDLSKTETTPIDTSFLKELSSRWEELNTKLEKDHAGLLFITKRELQDYLNFNSDLKKWQKHSIFRIEGQAIQADVFYPISEIGFLKHIPGISSRVCQLKLTLQPETKNKTLKIILKSISLPNWQTPLKINNISWPILIDKGTWKFLKAANITEFGVFLIFDNKPESGR